MIEQQCPQCNKKEFLIEAWYDREFLIRCATCKVAVWIIDFLSLQSISMKQWEAKAFLDRFPDNKKNTHRQMMIEIKHCGLCGQVIQTATDDDGSLEIGHDFMCEDYQKRL